MLCLNGSARAAFVATILALTAATSFSACARRQVVRTLTADDVGSVIQPSTVLFEAPHPVADVRAAIARALTGRNYTTESENGPQIVARQDARGASLRIAIDYSETQALIRYVDSTGLEVEERTGTAPLYNRWVSNLADSIRSELANPPVAPVAAQVRTPAPTLAVFSRAQEAAAVVPLLQRALTNHRWVIESQVEGALTVRLDHGGEQLRLRCEYTTTQANFVYIDSQGMNFDAQGRNDEYERWLRNLVQSVQNESR